jgi:hypothetical protein
VLQTSVAIALVPPGAQKPPRPAGDQLAARIALGITWGGLVSDGGHRKDQFRVLGSPSALHANIPRKGGPPGGREVRGPDFFR